MLMRQRLLLDRQRAALYLGVSAAMLAACGPKSAGPVVPVDVPVATAAQVAEWVERTQPRAAQLHRFKWLFQDERASAGGRGTARIAPPDTLRFDAADVYSTQPTAALVIGDQPQWIAPPDALEKMVPNYPLLWAMFGVARGPAQGMDLHGIADETSVAWRYVRSTDTVDYRFTRGRPSKLVTEVRQAGKVIGRAETTVGEDGAPLASKLMVPSVPARLTLTFLSTIRTTFAPETWLRSNP